MKIVIFNVRYSPNLGDGVLAECLERRLGVSLPGAEIETLDLAGRTAYGIADSRRSGALRLLQVMPPPARRILVARVLGSRLAALRALWRGKIAGADAVVIGGGNLLQDDDLNFPLKIAQVLELCREESCPVAIHAVGVGRHWSRRAAKLFDTLRTCNVLGVSVRDHGARQNWEQHFPDWPSPGIAPDPALTLQVEMHGRRDRTRPLVGICVTHPLILRRHAGASRENIPLGTVQGYGALAECLLDAGCDVVFFTNGAVEDQACLEHIRNTLFRAKNRAPDRCSFAARPNTPQELIALLGTFDAVAAHRLHACITAYALGVPPVGLGWDQKVESFFQMIGREPFFVSAHKENAEMIGERIVTTLGEGLDLDDRRRCIEKAEKAIEGLAAGLKMTIRGSERETA